MIRPPHSCAPAALVGGHILFYQVLHKYEIKDGLYQQEPTFSSQGMIAGCVLQVKGQHSCVRLSWQGQSSCETESGGFSNTWVPKTPKFKPPMTYQASDSSGLLQLKG